MSGQSDLDFEVTVGLNKIKDALLHPENRGYRQNCHLCYRQRKPCAEHSVPAIAPQERLVRRLALLHGVQTYVVALLKEIKEDTESIEAAKAARQSGVLELELP